MSPALMILLAGVVQGACNFTFKLMAGASSSIFTVAAFFVAAGLMLTGYGLLVRDGTVNAAAWGWAVLAAALITAADILLFRGLGGGAPAGVSFVVFAVVSMIVVVALGMFFLGERLNLYGWAGLGLAVVAIVLLSMGRAG